MHKYTTLLLTLTCGLASAQEMQSSSPQNSDGSAALGYYPVQINENLARKKGATNSAGYMLLRDIKGLVKVQSNGDGSYTLKTPGSTLRLLPGSRQATLNGTEVRLNATPFSMNNNTFFPLGSAYMLGCDAQATEDFKNIRKYQLNCYNVAGHILLDVVTFHNKNTGPGTPTAHSTISKLRAYKLAHEQN